MSTSTGSSEGQLLKFKRELKHVPIRNIEPNPENPREQIGKEAVDDLKESIRKVGVLVPLLVYPKPHSEGKYVIVEGERRWRASRELYQETKDERFSEVPVNILATAPGKFDNLVTMFNVHTKRRAWSRAAEADAVGNLRNLDKKQTSNTAKLADLTGLQKVRVEENLLYLRFPNDLRQRASKFGEYNLILLGRSLRSLEVAYPVIFSKYSWDEISRALIEKVSSGTIRRARDFIRLTSLAKDCLDSKNEAVFASAFDELVNKDQFGIDDMEKLVERELGYRVSETFRARCKDFLESLSAHVSLHEYHVDKSTHKILLEIAEKIQRTTAR